jgi:hypothetical protein
MKEVTVHDWVGTTLPPAGRIMKTLLAGGLALCVLGLFGGSPERLAIFSCPFHELTGLSCLTCGLTRSLQAVAHGHLVASLQYHLMGPIVFAGMLLACIRWSVEASAGRRIVLRWNARVRRIAITVVAGLWIIFCAARISVELVRL